MPSDHNYINPPDLTITLDDFRPKSWNQLKRMHYTKWHDEVIRCAWLMREAFGHTPPYFTVPVDISVIGYFNKRPYDSSNIPIKLFVDGLKGMVITDDDHRYVRRVSGESRIDRRRPRLELTVTQATSTWQEYPDNALVFILPNVKPLSWNKLARMNKYKWHKRVLAAKDQMIEVAGNGVFTPFVCRVDVTANLFVRSSPLDSDNVPTKLFEDGLIAAGILHDDSPKYVRRVQSMCVVVKRDPRLEIIVVPADDNK